MRGAPYVALPDRPRRAWSTWERQERPAQASRRGLGANPRGTELCLGTSPLCAHRRARAPNGPFSPDKRTVERSPVNAWKVPVRTATPVAPREASQRPASPCRSSPRSSKPRVCGAGAPLARNRDLWGHMLSDCIWVLFRSTQKEQLLRPADLPSAESWAANAASALSVNCDTRAPTSPQPRDSGGKQGLLWGEGLNRPVRQMLLLPNLSLFPASSTWLGAQLSLPLPKETQTTFKPLWKEKMLSPAPSTRAEANPPPQEPHFLVGNASLRT